MNALKRGRTLKPEAVEMARVWREERIKELQSLIELNPLNSKARRELRKMSEVTNEKDYSQDNL